MPSVTLEDVKSYLRITYDDDDALLETLISAADEYLKGAVHENFDSSLSRAKLLTMLVVSDLYENRGRNEGVSERVRAIVDDFALQMKLQKREESL